MRRLHRFPGIATAAIALVATTAGCDPSGRCPLGSICVYEDSAMLGSMKDFPGDDGDYGTNTWNGPSRSSPDDASSSLVNNTSAWVIFYIQDRLAGHAICLKPGSFISNLETFTYDIFGHTFGDAISSHDGRRQEPRLMARGGPCDFKV